MSSSSSSERATPTGEGSRRPWSAEPGHDLIEDRGVAVVSPIARDLVTAKQEEVQFRQVVTVIDGLVMVISFFIAYVIRDRYLGARYGPLYPVTEYIWVLWVVVPVWFMVCRRYGLHDSRTYSSLSGLLVAQTRAQLLSSLLLLSTMYLTKSWDVSRLLLESLLAVSFVGLVVERAVVRGIVTSLAGRRPSGLRNVLIVGNDALALNFAERIRESPHWRQRVVGFLAPDGQPNLSSNGHRMLGNTADITSVLHSFVVDEVVAASTAMDEVSLARLGTVCSDFGVTFRTLVKMPESEVGTFRVETVGSGLYLMTLESTSPGMFARAVKRVIDIVGALLGLVLCGLVYLWYARRLSRESPGPVLFEQSRVGKNGRIFTIYKFRTMIPGAEKHLEKLHAQNEMNGFIFKLRHDPRVVPSGGWLRKRHLDELPQFWNVLRGEMSIVGTRPPTPEEVNRYAPRHHRRLSIQPGITGLWQLAGNERANDFEQVVALDCEYIDRRSLWLDLQIMVRTVAKVLRAEGW